MRTVSPSCSQRVGTNGSGGKPNIAPCCGSPAIQNRSPSVRPHDVQLGLCGQLGRTACVVDVGVGQPNGFGLQPQALAAPIQSSPYPLRGHHGRLWVWSHHTKSSFVERR